MLLLIYYYSCFFLNLILRLITLAVENIKQHKQFLKQNITNY